MKYAGTASGICICLQTGLNSAPGKEFRFHKVFQLNINHIFTVNEKINKSSECPADENVGISIALKCYIIHSQNM